MSSSSTIDDERRFIAENPNPTTSKNNIMTTLLQSYDLKAVITHILIGFMVMFLGISVSTISYWLLFSPEIPDFFVTDMSMSISNDRPVNWNMRLSIRNRNKNFGMTCEGLNGSLVYFTDFVSLASVFPNGRLHIPKNQGVSFTAKFPVQTSDSNAVFILGDWTSTNRLELIFNMVGWVRFDGWHMRRQMIEVLCGTVVMTYNKTRPSGQLEEYEGERIIYCPLVI